MSARVEAPATQHAALGTQPLVRRRRPAWLSGSVVVAGLVILVLGAIAVVGPWLAPYEPTRVFAANTLAPPSARFLFGTDSIGRDVLSRVIAGTRVSLGVAFPSVGLALVVGLTVGLAIGLAGGWFDLLLMRLFDILFAFPAILLAVALVAVLGPNMTNLILTIAILYMPRFAIIARSSTLAVRGRDYVEAARCLGVPGPRLAFRHILPNIATPLVVEAALSLSTALLTEASLSFLGLGTQPPTPSWGGMLSQAQPYMVLAPWNILFPGLAIMIAVLAFNMVGDGLRDALDPRMPTK